MELKATIKEINDQELNLESTDGLKLIIPKIMLPDAKVEQIVYVTCALEPDKAARDTLNELLQSNA